MRDKLDLRYFDKGLWSNADPEDVPIEAQVEGSYNLDVSVNGKLKGIPKQTSASNYGVDGTKFAWIEKVGTTNQWDLIYTDGTHTKVITDFYGTQANSTLISSSVAQTIIPNNQEVHIGLGKDTATRWVGYISHSQFDPSGASAPSGLQVETADPAIPSSGDGVTSLTAHAASTEEEAVFPKGNMYQYAVSFVYDGYQESPLGGSNSIAISTKQVTTDVDYITVKLKILSYASINKRITGMKVYRREKPFYDSALWTGYEDYLKVIKQINKGPVKIKVPNVSDDLRLESGSLGTYGEYKLIKDIDINDSNWATSGSHKVYGSGDVGFQDDAVTGTSYFSNTGIQEDESRTSVVYGVNYGIAAPCKNMLFVANASHPRIPDDDAAHMILRSKSYRYDIFDWSIDKLILPSIPKAMKSFKGKLYVFDENTTYIIDPDLFQIEKTISGRGCSSQDSVVETDYGLFWANENGVYWNEITENLLKPVQDNLSERIKSQYQSAVSGVTPKLVYNSKRGQLLVHVGDDIFAYSTAEKRWDFYETYKLAGQATVTGVFIGKDGETYTVTGDDLYEDFNSGTTSGWRYYSKEFMFDDTSQDKKYYKIIIDSTGVTTDYYSIDGGDTFVLFTDEDVSTLRGKSLMIRVIGTAGSIVDSISILYRRLRGKR